MAVARAKLVDLTVTRWYHCVSRCVRKAFLLGEGEHSRQEWLENRLEELAGIFAGRRWVRGDAQSPACAPAA